MTGNLVFLRQISTGEVGANRLPPLRLNDYQEVCIGREPSCQIALDPLLYTGVSRRHALVRPLADINSSLWEIVDLDSANGTFVNGMRLNRPEVLSSGDVIVLGENGPQFIVEYQAPNLVNTTSQNPQSKSSENLSFTQLFPIASKGKDLSSKAFLTPAILTVIAVVLMFAFVGVPVAFNLLLASYLAGAAYYYIYRLCGKPKPWWILLLAGITTILILVSPLLSLFVLVFRGILPGNIPQQGQSVSIISLFIKMFFGAGLMEELLKALPVLGVFWFTRKMNPLKKELMGVTEPLDGILLGVASAVGFTLLETLGQYVPGIIDSVAEKYGDGAGELLGLQLLIPRVIGSIAGHMAYSGYLGYFIGLSVLKPQKRWQILIVGYLSASLLHALWNTTGFYNSIVLASVGVISYAFLAAAILKARELSPTRSRNFATRLRQD